MRHWLPFEGKSVTLEASAADDRNQVIGGIRMTLNMSIIF
jgi:hypothetical protein